MNTWFISDTHFGHANIIKYCNRPFSSVEEMDRIMVRKWNERVKPEDTVFFLGDFCFTKSKEAPQGKAFEYYKEKLNGNIIFIRGNHDRNNRNKTKIRNIIIIIGRNYINLVHDPQYADSKFKINLTGHVHEKWQCQRRKTHFGFTDCINVSVDVWNFYPVTYNELMKRYYTWRRNAKSR